MISRHSQRGLASALTGEGGSLPAPGSFSGLGQAVLRTLLPGLAWVAAGVGCSGDGVLLEAETSGGTWKIELAEDSISMDTTQVLLSVSSHSSPSPGLLLQLAADMPEMDHFHEPVVCEEMDSGEYQCGVSFSMTGLWDLQGEVSDDTLSETFTLTVDVY